MFKLYDAPDENEIESIFSDGYLEEYWENIKRNVITEVNIAVEREQAIKNDKADDNADEVRKYIVK